MTRALENDGEADGMLVARGRRTAPQHPAGADCSWGPSTGEAMAGVRPGVLRTALLVLLAERDSHGYDLAPRLSELGVAADMGSLYRTLRSLDRQGDVRSAWDTSSQGPARRIYALTADGRRLLGQALVGLEEHSLTVARLLRRSQQTNITALPVRQGA